MHAARLNCCCEFESTLKRMRLVCDVEVCNRLLPAFNIKAKNKASKAQVSVGQKPGADKEDSTYLMICTKQDRNGAKYKLQGNVENIFAKFIQDGKATVRLKCPPHDVCLSKADPIQLKGFLGVVKLGHQGKGLDKVTLSSLAPASTNQMEKLKTKMTIKSRKDYPITAGFPPRLETLAAHDCNLKIIDSRILQLRNLRILDLSKNRLQKLPEDWWSMTQLSELKLAENQISEIPAGLCKGHLTTNLRLLDLSHNKIKHLRPYMCQLRGLVTLNLNYNQLVNLPFSLSNLTQLRSLSVAHNQLRTLPAHFSKLSLNDIDLYNNPLLQDGPASAINRLSFPTLQELAARTIKLKKVLYTEEDLHGRLIEFLESSKKCLCGNICFRSFVHYLSRLDLRNMASTVTAVDTSGRTHVPMEAFLCSQRCLDLYQKNPNSSIWRIKAN